MSEKDGHISAEDFFLQGISGNRLEVLVHLRRYEDIQELADQINGLTDKIKKLERDIYSWSLTGAKYIQALDDLRELQRICKREGIAFDFQSLR